MTNLTFSGSELAKYLSDTTSLNATCKKGIELFGAGGDGDELAATSMHFRGSCESQRHEFGGFHEELSGFLLRDAFYLFEDSDRGVGNRLDGIVAALDDELDVALGEP